MSEHVILASCSPILFQFKLKLFSELGFTQLEAQSLLRYHLRINIRHLCRHCLSELPSPLRSRQVRVSCSHSSLLTEPADLAGVRDPHSDAIVLARANLNKLDQLFSDIGRVVVPEAIKAFAAADAAFLASTSQLNEVSISIDASARAGQLDFTSIAAYRQLALQLGALEDGRILLVACDKLFDTAVDAACFATLRDGAGLVPPFSSVFPALDVAMSQIECAKIRAISTLFHVTKTLNPLDTSPGALLEAISDCKVRFVSQFMAVLFGPVLIHLTSAGVKLDSSTAPSSSVCSMFDSICDAAASHQQISHQRKAISDTVAAQADFVAQCDSESVGFQLTHDNALFATAPHPPGLVRRSHLLHRFRSASARLNELAAEISMCEQAYFSYETEILRAIHALGKSPVSKLIQEKVVARRQIQRMVSQRLTSMLNITAAILSFEALRSTPTVDLPCAHLMRSFMVARTRETKATAAVASLRQQCELLSEKRETLVSQISDLDAALTAEYDSDLESRLRISPTTQNSAAEVARLASLVQELWADVSPILVSVKRVTDQWKENGPQNIHHRAKATLFAFGRLHDACTYTAKVMRWLADLRPDLSLSPLEIEYGFHEVLPNALLVRPLGFSSQVVIRALSDCVRLATEWLEGSEIQSDIDDSPDDPPLQDAPEILSPPVGLHKNETALLVLRKVKHKLEGSELRQSTLSVAEQVDLVVKAATNVDNLCRMYEGWTAWI